MILGTVFKSINAQQGPLMLTYVKAFNLPDKDDVFSGISDPYVKIYKCIYLNAGVLGSKSLCDYSNAVQLPRIDGNEDPEWEKDLDVEIPNFWKDSKWNQLELQFWDYDPTSGDDHLRTVKFNIDNNIACGSTKIETTSDTLNTIYYEFKCTYWDTLKIDQIVTTNLPDIGPHYFKIFLCTSLTSCDYSKNYVDIDPLLLEAHGATRMGINPEWKSIDWKILFERGKWRYIRIEFWSEQMLNGHWEHSRSSNFFIGKFNRESWTIVNSEESWSENGNIEYISGEYI